jgi:hypothetical protein
MRVSITAAFGSGVAGDVPYRTIQIFGDRHVLCSRSRWELHVARTSPQLKYIVMSQRRRVHAIPVAHKPFV